MKQQDLFTNNLIQLMRDVLAGPVLSRIHRARLDSRIRMQTQQPPVEPFSSLKGELRETPRSGEEAQRYLWPLDAFIPELTEEPMEWEAFMRSEPEPQISLPKIPHETRMPEAQGWLFSIRDEPSADVSLSPLLSPAFQSPDLKIGAHSSSRLKTTHGLFF
ncbi:hypothetical protein HYR99_25335, partial [Candidatus Poribacteria bacterium]|nr:hypothetical protein [Candidatus Poribacteria bacterium]